MHQYRTHNCNELRADNIDNTVRLSGWVHRKRVHCGLLFFDLRDDFWVTLLVFDADSETETLALLQSIKSGNTEAIDRKIVDKFLNHRVEGGRQDGDVLESYLELLSMD